MPGVDPWVVREAMRKSAPTLIFYLVLLGLYLALPQYSQFIATILFYAILGQAFNIFMGMTGYVDFGYVAFLASGAYAFSLAAIALSNAGITGWIFIPIGLAFAALVAAILASIVGAIALRLRGAYFAIATIGVNEGLRYFVEGANLFGGSIGLYIVKNLKALVGREGYQLAATLLADLLMFLLAAITVLVTGLILSSRLGYALQAIREDEDAAKALGINVTRYKVTAFIISGMLGGMLGALNWALKGGVVEPAHVFFILYTVEAIVIVMLGGAGTLLGPVFGAITYIGLNYISNVYVAPILEGVGIKATGLHLIILAPILLAIIIAAPNGIVGLLKERVKNPRIRSFIT